ncbi:MAG: hypothetical protein MUF84_16295 [Anaerolineae bacterium]|jgi:hypothetical protein|nr:hypothetical protein [Anaerolineae bacterium]
MLSHNIDTLFALAQYQQERALTEARRNHLAKLAKPERKRERRGFRLTWRAPRIEEVLASEFACTWNPAAC